jgi:hypothetical protein
VSKKKALAAAVARPVPAAPRASHVIRASRGRAQAKARVDDAIESVRLAADIELAGARLAELVDGDFNATNAVAKLRNIAAHVAFGLIVEARNADRFGFHDRIAEFESWLHPYAAGRRPGQGKEGQAQLAVIEEAERKLGGR